MRPVLITIPFSHYCEKARWALQRAGVDFAEEEHVPFASRLATWRRGRWGSVPALVTDDGFVTDSTHILHWADARARAGRELYPADAAIRLDVDAWEERLDESFGDHTRRVAYSHMLPHRALLTEISQKSRIPTVEQYGLQLLYPVARALIRRGLHIDERHVADSRAIVETTFAAVSDRLADGRRYLAGDGFTAADLTFAALAAPVLVPPQYGGPLPAFDHLPPAARDEIERMRATPAGRFALRLYQEDRWRREEV